MSIPKFDFHMHTKYLGCANETMQIPAILHECKHLGMSAIAITDHANRMESVPLHKNIRDDLLSCEPELDVYFGVELDFAGCDQGFTFGREVMEENGFQLAIGGIHHVYTKEYDLTKIVEIQHRHHLKTCRDPIIDVLVHPYWFNSGEFKRLDFPWENQMKAVPESFARELAQVAKETNTAIEINGGANIQNHAHIGEYRQSYFDYLSILADEGVSFCLGSDAHDIKRLVNAVDAWKVAVKLGVPEDRIWQPACEPFRKRK